MRYSTDLLTWTELNASVPAQGERTTATAIAPTTSTLFYRVEQNYGSGGKNKTAVGHPRRGCPTAFAYSPIARTVVSDLISA